jgi:adenylyl-sulfate kinase
MNDYQTKLGEQMTQKGFTLWFTGLSGAGKTTLARLIESEIKARGHMVEVLDGDIIRTNLSKGLGFSKEDRDTNIRRIGFVCNLLTRNNVVAIAAAISPYRAVRDEVRRDIGAFVEVYVRCPIDVLAERDVKGLYKKALAGEIKNFTGVDDPYESPLAAEVIVDTDTEAPEESATRILAKLEEMSLLAARVIYSEADEEEMGRPVEAPGLV